MSDIYPAAKEKFLGAGGTSINWLSNNIRVILVSSAYVFDAAHQTRASLSGHENGVSANLTGKAVTGGVARANNTTLLATAAITCNALVVYRDSGNVNNDPLIAYINDVGNLPATPLAGQGVNIFWDAAGIFKL